MNSIIVMNKPKDPVSEAYRTLRTNIQYSSLDKSIKIIAVTSAGPGEGKSTTACNLAMVIAQAGKKVLLIDADMRKPSVHKKFNISNKTGLSNLLIEGLKINEVALKVTPNMDVLTSGTIPPNPAEVISSQKMSNFLRAMAEEYDNIIIDTPPVIVVTDAQILATKSDGVIIVVSQGEASIDAVKRAKELLMAVNADILGVVFNKVELRSGKGFKNGHYNYYYYGHDEKKDTRNKKKK